MPKVGYVCKIRSPGELPKTHRFSGKNRPFEDVFPTENAPVSQLAM